MAIGNITPFQFISFTFPNPLLTKQNPYTDSLRIALLDSPHQPSPTDPPQLVAAMLVPINRENDWIFSTESGHLQLLLNSPGISRLILIGNLPLNHADSFQFLYKRTIQTDTDMIEKFELSLTPLLFALSPKSAFTGNNLPEIPFVTYEDNVVSSVLVEKCVGSCIGEMLVEDVEVEIESSEENGTPTREFRRRLRFKRMPNLIQTETRIIQVGDNEFRPDTSCLVHPYLPPMVASLSLIATYLEREPAPKVLCIGVGGGALVSFLQTHFKFQIYGVESDEMVMQVANNYFGLIQSELVRVFIQDGIGFLEKNARECDRFDVIMVDLDASDATSGIAAPPLDFIKKQVLLASRLALHNHGILVVNVIPVSRTFYDYLIAEFQAVFAELYEICVVNGENYVLIAAVAPLNLVSASDTKNSILNKLKHSIGNQYIDCIRKIQTRYTP